MEFFFLKCLAKIPVINFYRIGLIGEDFVAAKGSHYMIVRCTSFLLYSHQDCLLVMLGTCYSHLVEFHGVAYERFHGRLRDYCLENKGMLFGLCTRRTMTANNSRRLASMREKSLLFIFAQGVKD